MRSIRSYLLSRMLGGAAVVLTGAGLAVYLVVARSLEAQFDRNLADRVQGFASILFQVEDDVEFEFSDQLMPEYEPGPDPAYFEIRHADGELHERSNSLAGQDLALPAAPAREPSFWTGPLPDGREGRFVARLVEVHHVYPEEGPDRPQAATLSVVIARGREELVAAERAVLLECAAVSLVLILLIASISWRAVKRGLEPADRLAAALDAIVVDDLPAGLDAGALPAELAPVAQKADALIRRVDTALERERRTTADIAHELRTPISELLTVAEVALRAPRNGNDGEHERRALGMVRDVAWRMGGSVSTLLKLARLEMGAETFQRTRVDLDGLLREVLRSLSALERERGLKVANEVERGALVDGDGEVLRIVASNLLSNALYYSPRDEVVRCRLDRSNGAWRFLVENRAPNLSTEDLSSLSEPFWRKDRARADRERSGLGLALSRALAEKAGMELSFELEAGTFRAILIDRHVGDGPLA